MNIYYAPMEGITNVYFRQLHHEFFAGVDAYFTPFIGIYAGRCIKKRDEREIDRAQNEGINLIPQILTNHSDDFLWLYRKLRNLGYEEVNLNLGCPSGTVTGKGRGSGFLKHLDELEIFFDEIFNELGDDASHISVKSRIGFNDASEMEQISELYSKYPFKELTIHPRVRKQFYKGYPDMDAFKKALGKSSCPVCYNGNIFTVSDYEKLANDYSDAINSTNGHLPKLSSVMLGRGIVSNPALAREIKGGDKLQINEFKAFRKELENMYTKEFDTEKNVLFKMKELWSYMSTSFESSDKYIKAILKSKSFAEYESAARMLENNCTLI